MPNSGSYEPCYPERETTIVGNLVYDNNQADTPAIDVALLAMGNGILVAGAVKTIIERNLVYNHERTGIGLVPFPEADANDVPPASSKWALRAPQTVGHQRPREQVPEDRDHRSGLRHPLGLAGQQDPGQHDLELRAGRRR